MTEGSAPVSAGRSAVDDAADVARVLEVRQLRRRIAVLRSSSALLILMSIFVTCGSVAVPNFIKFGCRARQSEAKGNLKALYVAEKAYRGEFDLYSPDARSIGFEPKGSKLRYTYVITDVTKEGFVGWAFGTDAWNWPDAWRIDEAGQPRHLVDACDR